MTGWTSDDFDDDDLHIEAGDSGLENRGQEMPDFLDVDFTDDSGEDRRGIWDNERSLELSPEMSEFEEFLSQYGFGLNEVLANDEGRFQNVQSGIDRGVDIRGTLYASPEDAFRAGVDGGIASMTRVYYDAINDAYVLGVDYPKGNR